MSAFLSRFPALSRPGKTILQERRSCPQCGAKVGAKGTNRIIPLFLHNLVAQDTGELETARTLLEEEKRLRKQVWGAPRLSLGPGQVWPRVGARVALAQHMANMHRRDNKSRCKHK